MSEVVEAATRPVAKTKSAPKNDFQPAPKLDIDGMLGEGLSKGKAETPVETPKEPEKPVAEAAIEKPVEVKPAEAKTEAKVEAPVEVDDFEAAYKEESARVFGEPPVEAPKPAEAKAPTVDASKELDFILNDPELKYLYEARKAGKSVMSALTEIKPYDVAALSSEQLILEDCKRLNITDPEKIASEIDAYNAMTPRQQAQEDNRIRGMLEKEQSDRLARFRDDATKQQAESAKATEALDKEIESMCASKAGSKYFGITITPEINDAVKNEVYSGLGLFNNDGTYNSKVVYDLAFLKTQHALMMRSISENMYHKGRGETLELVTKPSKNETTAKPPVAADTARNPGDEIIAELTRPRQWSK